MADRENDTTDSEFGQSSVNKTGITNEKESSVNLTEGNEETMNQLNNINESVQTTVFSSTQVGENRFQEVTNQSIAEMSKTMEKSTMVLTMASIKIDPCVPLSGETEISVLTYNRWKEVLLANVGVLPDLSENEKYAFFKRSAGNTLLDVLDGLTLEKPSELSTKPFTDALKSLDDHFMSSQNYILQIVNFRSAKQNAGESAIKYLSRVLRHAKQSGLTGKVLEKELIITIASNSTDTDLQKKALEDGCTFQKLKDYANALELMKSMNNKRTGKQSEVNDVEVHTVDVNQVGKMRYQQRYRRSEGRGKRTYNQPRLSKDCSRCGYDDHSSSNCPNINKTCNNCNRTGHFAKMCRSRPPVKRVYADERAGSSKKEDFGRKKMKSDQEIKEVSQSGVMSVEMKQQAKSVQNRNHIIKSYVGGLEVEFMIDSGSSANTVTEDIFENLLENESRDRVLNISPSADRKLVAYAGVQPLEVIATFESDLYIDDTRPHGLESFYVVMGAKRSLLGRETSLRYKVLQIGLNVNQIMDEICVVSELKEFPKFNLSPVKLVLNSDVKPRRFTYTNISLPFVELVKTRIKEMLDTDIIEELTREMDKSFCSALLVVPKGKDDVRLVVDLRGVNKAIIREPHNMPSFDKIISQLHGSVKFSTIDLTSAFSHVVLDKESRHVTNFYSGEKFYRYKRLPFGLCNAPDIFQAAMENVLSGCEGVVIYIDDILVYGKSREQHDKNLREVMKRLKLHNVKLNMGKCKLNTESCVFLGFLLNKDGYQVSSDKIEAISNFRHPENIPELRSFLGLMNFVDKFILNRVDKTDVLQSIVRSKQFNWTEEAEKQFEYMKTSALKAIKTLGFYNIEHKTELIVDASPVGLGAVLVQYDETDKPRIIACASKSLSPTEHKYSQASKEALALVWGVERFQYYLRGLKFTLTTDAEANEFIFGSQYRLNKRAISRAETYALRLSQFDFSMKTVKGRKNIADAFSRLIRESQRDLEFDDARYENINSIIEDHQTALTREDIEKETGKDIMLSKVIECLSSGQWPKQLEHYQALRRQLYVVRGVIFFRDKYVIPSSLRQEILDKVHQGHFGIESMKRILRSSVWWPNVGKDVESLVAACFTCQRLNRLAKPLPIQSRELPEHPWQIIQIDFLSLPGCGSEEFLMVTDTFSRMFWIVEMHRTNTSSTVKALWDIFKIWGKPDVIQSDNGPPFNSEAFTIHWKENGVHHRCVVPYCAFQNGMVERRNQGIIRAVAAAKVDGLNWRDALQQHVHVYNNIRPHKVTGATPFELMTGRKFNGFFPAIYNDKIIGKNQIPEDIRERDALAKLKAKLYADKRRGAKESGIKEGDWVLIANKHRRNKIEATFLGEKFMVLSRDGPKLVVKGESGKEYIRYVSDVKRLVSNNEDNEGDSGNNGDIEAGDLVVKRARGKDSNDSEKNEQFANARYKVLHENDGNLFLRGEDGSDIVQHASVVKKQDKVTWKDLKPGNEDSYEDPELNGVPVLPRQTTEERPKRAKLMPRKFKDYSCYNIFG